jgi:hypothetical protein
MRKDGPLLYRMLYRSLLDVLHEVWFSKFRVQDLIQVLVGVGLITIVKLTENKKYREN